MSVLSKFLSRFGIPEVHLDVEGDLAKSIHTIAAAHEVHAALETRGNLELSKQLGDAADAYFTSLDHATTALSSAGAASLLLLLNGVGSDISPAFNKMRDLTAAGQAWLNANPAPEVAPPLA